MPAITRNTDPIWIQSPPPSCTDQAGDTIPSVQSNNLNVVKKDDLTLGLDATPSPGYDIASPNVFKLNQAVVRVGDLVKPHPGNPPHTGHVVKSGSLNVFVNSGGGAGAVIDNNIPLINVGQVNPSPPPTPPNMKSLSEIIANTPFVIANPHISPIEIEFYESDDEETAKPSPPAGTVTRPDRTPKEADPTTPAVQPPPTYTCAGVASLPANFSWTDVSGNFDSWAQSFQLSANFTVYDLTVGPAVSTYRFSANPTQPVGLTQKQILTNLCYLANVVLQPMRNQLGSFILTSVWRSATNGSQHNKGQAADIQFPAFHGTGQTGQQYFTRAQLIRDQYNYDQMILEWFGKNPWIHISVNPVNHRKQVLTQVATNSYQPGLTRLG